MAKYAYSSLSFLDNSFLLTEKANCPMHVGAVSKFEGGGLIQPDGGIDIDTIRAYVASRLHLVPRYRQRLFFPPLSRPLWVDDPHFNIHYHVRHAALPKPGDDRQLKRLAARVMEQHLDRNKPLWELWFVEGLADGGHFAMISKIHHCMVDGVSTADLLNVLLQPAPTAEAKQGPDWVPRPAPTAVDLAAEALVHMAENARVERLAELPGELIGSLRRALHDVRDPHSTIWNRLRSTGEMVEAVANITPTPINQPIGPHRRTDWCAMDLAEVKAVKNALGGTVNDVVLTTVSGALRRFLGRHRVNLEGLDFRILVPVSQRPDDQRGTLGNQVAGWIVPLPLSERDPEAVLAIIRETTARLKASTPAINADGISGISEWATSTLLSLGSRLAIRALPFNTGVTNVPGVQIPLYMLGARMLDAYPMLPLGDYVCMAIALFSYDGQLSWGFTCDWDLMPDLHDFVLDIETSFDELRRIATAVPSGVSGESTHPKRVAVMARE